MCTKNDPRNSMGQAKQKDFDIIKEKKIKEFVTMGITAQELDGRNF